MILRYQLACGEMITYVNSRELDDNYLVVIEETDQVGTIHYSQKSFDT